MPRTQGAFATARRQLPSESLTPRPELENTRKSHVRSGWEDSNSQMSLPKLAFEVWPEFPFISERLAIRDFSRLSCEIVDQFNFVNGITGEMTTFSLPAPPAAASEVISQLGYS